ncbi:MAG TPA: hypothetical protein VHX38_15210 [Pseudonocardiaceae bacterium]|jgi:hypothetical protein|nr:hypothetical protein [Pseudonocardiaceae bacterium]
MSVVTTYAHPRVEPDGSVWADAESDCGGGLTPERLAFDATDGMRPLFYLDGIFLKPRLSRLIADGGLPGLRWATQDDLACYPIPSGSCNGCTSYYPLASEGEATCDGPT